MHRMQAEDIDAVMQLARASHLYTSAQLSQIHERCTAFAAGRPADDYEVWLHGAGDGLHGWLIFRRRSLTQAAYELAQLAAREESHLPAMLDALRQTVAGRGGRLVFAELPDHAGWVPVHAALLASGYTLAGSLPHLFAPGLGTRYYVQYIDGQPAGAAPAEAPAAPATGLSGAPGIAVEACSPRQRAAILDMTAATPVFSREDLATVEELLDIYLERGPAGGYEFLSACAQGEVIAYACFGPRESTAGAYDMYWICTDARRRQQGAGRSLMAAIEGQVLERGGYLVTLETSDSAEYAPTRKFYAALGYARAAHILEFYAPGDGLVVYARYLKVE